MEYWDCAVDRKIIRTPLVQPYIRSSTFVTADLGAFLITPFLWAPCGPERSMWSPVLLPVAPHRTRVSAVRGCFVSALIIYGSSVTGCDVIYLNDDVFPPSTTLVTC